HDRKAGGRSVTRSGHLVPRAAVEHAPGDVLSNPTPLLEEEPHITRDALIANRTNPCRVHRACAVTTFAADDHPVDALQVELLDRPEQWLYAQEPDDRIDPTKIVDARCVLLAFHADAHPDVPRDIERRCHRGHALGTLRQYLELVSGRLPHDAEHAPHIRVGHLLVEQVRHAVHEDAATRTPSEW